MLFPAWLLKGPYNPVCCVFMLYSQAAIHNKEGKDKRGKEGKGRMSREEMRQGRKEGNRRGEKRKV